MTARLVPALVAAVAIAGAVACAARPQRSETQPPLPPVGQVHDQIAALDAEIAAGRAQLGQPDPTLEEIDAARTTSAFTAATCTPDAHPTCRDVCTLADSICGNADKICALGAQLPGDEWAEQRCQAGRVSCAKARERCCACAG